VLVLATDLSLQVKVFVVLTAGAVFYFAPNYLVWLRRQSRTAEVRRHLPDGVDLLEICVSAGMGLDMAWNSVAEEIRGLSTVLADEMALTNLEMHLGAPRADAMRHMAERTGAEELSSLVALLVQSDRFGTKISDTLRTFAQTMREERGLKAQETAEKMAVKLLFPLVLFIFPAVLIVIVGPAAIALYKHLLTT
jgi:tight adherence protein C